MYIFVFLSRNNHTLFDHVDSSCIPPNCFLETICFIHTWEFRFQFTCSFAVIRKYNLYFVNFARTCLIFILLLQRKHRAQIKKKWYSSLTQKELVRISEMLHSSTFGSRFGIVRLGYKNHSSSTSQSTLCVITGVCTANSRPIENELSLLWDCAMYCYFSTTQRSKIRKCSIIWKLQIIWTI